MEFKAARCPNCGGDIQVPTDRDIVKCMYCGNDVIVMKAIAEAAKTSVPSLIKLAKNAFEGKNYSESYEYYTKVLELDSNNEEAWIAKGLCTGYMSTGANIRYDEAAACFKRALELNPQSEAAKSAWLDVKNLTIRFLTSLASDQLSKGKETYKRWDPGFFTDKTRNPQEAVKYAYPYMKSCFEYLEYILAIDPENMQAMKELVQMFQEGPDVWDSSLRDRIVNKYKAKIQEKDKNYEAPTKSGCFVATACYVSKNAYEVQILRNWRDEYLLNYFIGTKIIELYYRIGPAFAKVISNSPSIKNTVRSLMDSIVKFVRRRSEIY